MAVARQQNDPHAFTGYESPARSQGPRPREHAWLARCVYVLLTGAVLLEVTYGPIGLPDDPGRNVPFFQDIATWTHIKGIAISIADIFMALLLVATLVAGLADRTFRFNKGSLMRPLGLYMTMILVAEVHGLTSGGNSNTSLWEIRGQAYLLIAYLLTCNIIKTRRQVDMLIWIILVGTGLRGVQGVWRYRVTYHGSLAGVESIFPHEQSFFFNAFLTLAAILFVYGGSRRMKRIVLFFLPFVMVSSLANQRRTGILALVIGMAVLLLITAIAHPARRRIVVAIVLILAIVAPPYYLAFQHSNGMLGEIAHALSSITSPDTRDAGSNLYRINEDKDILATMKSSTTSMLIGYGFGKTMLVPYPLADISQIYVWWNVMPHDSILWVWMRLGTVGYALLWFMIGTAIIQAARLMRRLNDPYLKGLALWIILMIIQQVIFAYLDLQWTNYRNLIVIGMLFALISRLATFVQHDDASDAPSHGEQATAYAWKRRPDLPRSLAVIEGRLARTASRHGGVMRP